MRQNLAKFIVSRIAILNMFPQLLHMIQPLFPNKHGPTLETNFTKCLLMLRNEMALQRLDVGELLIGVWAVLYHTIEGSKHPAIPLSFIGVIVNAIIIVILLAGFL